VTTAHARFHFFGGGGGGGGVGRIAGGGGGGGLMFAPFSNGFPPCVKDDVACEFLVGITVSIGVLKLNPSDVLNVDEN
jgi:hypothetical protein